MRIFLIVLFILCSVVQAEDYDSLLKEIHAGKDKTMAFVHQAIKENKLQDARLDLFDYQKTVKKLGNVDSVYAVAGGRNYLSLLSSLQEQVDPDVAVWVVKDADRLHEFLSLISPDDDLPKVFNIITDLYKADEKERDKFFSLILAFAVVWDTDRPLLHNYMGKQVPKYEKDVLARYNFLKAVYSKKSPMAYKYLSSRMLVYVVDLPLPLSELEWAVKNEKGSASSWGQKFDDVKYDKPRFDRNAFSWGHGAYTFAALKKAWRDLH